MIRSRSSESSRSRRRAVTARVERDHAAARGDQRVDDAGRRPVAAVIGCEAVQQQHGLALAAIEIGELRAVEGADPVQRSPPFGRGWTLCHRSDHADRAYRDHHLACGTQRRTRVARETLWRIAARIRLRGKYSHRSRAAIDPRPGSGGVLRMDSGSTTRRRCDCSLCSRSPSRRAANEQRRELPRARLEQPRHALHGRRLLGLLAAAALQHARRAGHAGRRPGHRSRAVSWSPTAPLRIPAVRSTRVPQARPTSGATSPTSTAPSLSGGRGPRQLRHARRRERAPDRSASTPTHQLVDRRRHSPHTLRRRRQEESLPADARRGTRPGDERVAGPGRQRAAGLRRDGLPRLPRIRVGTGRGADRGLGERTRPGARPSPQHPAPARRKAGRPIRSTPDALATSGYGAGLFATATSGGTPILCAACHLSNALPGTGLPGVEPLTEATPHGPRDGDRPTERSSHSATARTARPATAATPARRRAACAARWEPRSQPMARSRSSARTATGRCTTSARPDAPAGSTSRPARTATPAPRRTTTDRSATRTCSTRPGTRATRSTRGSPPRRTRRKRPSRCTASPRDTAASSARPATTRRTRSRRRRTATTT